MREAEQAAERALEKARLALAKAEHDLQTTLDSAARLQDGTRVFRDEQGRVRTVHGATVSDLGAASIEWSGDEPAYEQFLGNRSTIESLGGRIDKIERLQVDVLGHARDVLSDQENPASADEIERLRADILESMESLKQDEFLQRPAEVDTERSAAIEMPSLK